MKTKRQSLLSALLVTSGLILASAAHADDYETGHGRWCHPDRGLHHGHYRHGYRHEAREVIVVNHYDSPRPVVEIHERVVERPVVTGSPYRHGYRHSRYREEYHSATPVILGGILGGVVGNHMGKGRGRDIATVAGVLLGGSIGRDLAHDH